MDTGIRGHWVPGIPGYNNTRGYMETGIRGHRVPRILGYNYTRGYKNTRIRGKIRCIRRTKRRNNKKS